jgi:hypothetical protein
METKRGGGIFVFGIGHFPILASFFEVKQSKEFPFLPSVRISNEKSGFGLLAGNVPLIYFKYSSVDFYIHFHLFCSSSAGGLKLIKLGEKNMHKNGRDEGG